MTPVDLQRLRASQGWRQRRVEVFHDTSEGSVVVKGQRAARPRWRYQVLNAVARIAGLPLLRAAPALGGAAAQQIELARLRSLAAAGVQVPEVLHDEVDFFVMRWLGAAHLDKLLQRDGEFALRWWQRGLRTLVDLHARDQYLSQAFARNFIARGDTLAMIDFEDDPLQVMPLDQAQARDWLTYLHSSAHVLAAQRIADGIDPTGLLRAELAREREPVRRLVADTSRRLAWLLRLDATQGRAWHRHVAVVQSVLRLALSATAAPIEATDTPEALHARHH